MYILPVKCHLPYKSACVYFDSHGGRASSFMSNVIFLINLPVCTLIATGGAFMSNVICLINLPVCTLIAMGGGGGVRACYMYILPVKCHLPYKSACVYFDSHGGRGCI